MCCQFWNLRLQYECPMCGSLENGELQTHWMGDLGSCLDYFELGAPIAQLRGIEPRHSAKTAQMISSRFAAPAAARLTGERKSWMSELSASGPIAGRHGRANQLLPAHKWN